MRKDRNTFFSDPNMFQSNYPGAMMQQQPMMMPSPAPYQQPNASNSFYNAPAPIQQPIQQYPTNTSTDYESRIAKMERQIRRLETRVNKLESEKFSGGSYQGVEETDSNYSSSMYMI